MTRTGLGGLILALWVLAPHLEAQTSLLPATGDSTLKSGSPNQNQGAETVLRLQSSGQNRALVQFDPAAIQAAVGAGSLASARLELFIAFNSDNWGTEGRTVDAHRLTQAWTEAGVTWNCPVDSIPTNGSPNCASQWAGGSFAEEPSDTVLHTNGLAGWIAFDVTADLRAFLAGASHFGWLVKKADEGQNGRVDYASKESAGGNGPRLVLVVESPTHDEVPPRLAITAPNQPILINQPTPAIALEYSDGGTGVNLSSLAVRVDGALATCAAGPTSASCQAPALVAGSHAISAQLMDHAGNLATASFSFELLTGPGLHTLRLPVVADTTLRQGSPNQNQGSEPLLRLQQSGKNRALLKVDPAEAASLLSGATVHSARLELFVAANGNNWGSTGRTVDLHRATAGWTELGATWSCADDSDPTNQQPNCAAQWNGGSYDPLAVGSLLVTNGLQGLVGFDVTADLAAMAGGASHDGWLLKKTQEGQSGRVEFASREGAPAQQPAVVVVFETVDGIDSTPPVITVEAPADGSLLSTSLPEIRAEYTDSESGIDAASIRFYLDGMDRTSEALVTASSLLLQPLEPLFEGLHQVAVIVWDNALNIEQAAWSFRIDSIPPRLTLISPAANQRVHQPEVQLSGEVEDDLGVAGVSINGTPVALTGSAFSAAVPLVEGGNLMRVSAVDLAGNSSERLLSVERFSLPEIRITAPADLSTQAATTVRVSGSVSEGVAQVNVNGVIAQLVGLAFEAPEVPLVEGGNVLTATAVDSQGRTTTDSVSIVRDLTPPRIALYYPRDGASTLEAEVAATGLINDLVPGTVNTSEVTVTVNGQPAEVANRSFLLASLPLAIGSNLIEVAATDEAGNFARVEARVERLEGQRPRVVAVSGFRQTGVIGSILPEPFEVELRDALGQPVAGKAVLFKVRGGEGALDGAARQRAVTTNASGRAQTRFTLGGRAGVGNQLVEASAVGFAGPALLVATALPGDASLIVVDSGDQQVGVAGRELPRPLVAAVTDRGFNRLAGTAVRFMVVKGGGRFDNDLSEIETTTDSDGRAIVSFVLDALEGSAANVVEAHIDGLADGPAARFVATGRAAGTPDQTSISGVVLDNSNQPVPGVTLRVRDTLLTAETNVQGFFRILEAPVGTVHLIVDGSTAEGPGAWPDLEFVLTTIPGRDNDVGMPIYLVPIALGSGLYVDETRGGTLTIPEMPGFSLEILPGSVVFPGGSRSGVVSATVVHSDKVPMVPSFGQQPRFIVTIQPAGARFEPTARMVMPNVEGLPPGSVTEFYSFDHDLGHFVSIGPATVTEDGLLIVSNPGVGLVKAGWHCGGNPAFAGTPHNCPECERCVGGFCQELPQGSACQDDGDACTRDICQGGGCFHRPVDCPECKKCDGGDCVADAGKDGRSCGTEPGKICKSGDCICPVPVNFHQVGPGTDAGNGVLHFHYDWDSSSGNLADLKDCKVGEIIFYPVSGGQFTWPPPWQGTSQNPNAAPPIIGSRGSFFDDHGTGPLGRPFQSASLVVMQRYAYTCPCTNQGQLVPIIGPIPITRTIFRNPDGTFSYQITKSGASAVINPLP